DQQGSARARLQYRHSAAERDGLVAHGPCVAAHAHGRDDTAQADERLPRALATRGGPCGYLDAVDGVARAQEGREVATRPRAGEVCRTRLAVETRIRQSDHGADATRRRVGRL